jgi:hypothetical protein
MAGILVIVTLLAGIVAEWAGRRRNIRGLRIGYVLAIPLVLEGWVVANAPGASYLIAWPLLGAMLAVLLLSTAPPVLGIGWRVAAIALCAAPGFLLILPLVSSLIVALTLSRAVPVLAAAAVLLLICLLPQLVFLLRRPINRATA